MRVDGLRCGPHLLTQSMAKLEGVLNARGGCARMSRPPRLEVIDDDDEEQRGGRVRVVVRVRPPLAHETSLAPLRVVGKALHWVDAQTNHLIMRDYDDVLDSSAGPLRGQQSSVYQSVSGNLLEDYLKVLPSPTRTCPPLHPSPASTLRRITNTCLDGFQPLHTEEEQGRCEAQRQPTRPATCLVLGRTSVAGHHISAKARLLTSEPRVWWRGGHPAGRERMGSPHLADPSRSNCLLLAAAACVSKP